MIPKRFLNRCTTFMLKTNFLRNALLEVSIHDPSLIFEGFSDINKNFNVFNNTPLHFDTYHKTDSKVCVKLTFDESHFSRR